MGTDNSSYIRLRLKLVMLVISSCFMTSKAQITSTSIITETAFAQSDYYLIASGFFEGMKFSKDFSDSETCLTAFTAFLDDLYYFNYNYTNTGVDLDGYEDKFFNVTAIISGPMQQSMKYCSLFAK